MTIDKFLRYIIFPLFLFVINITFEAKVLLAQNSYQVAPRTVDEEQTINVYKNTRDAVVFITTTTYVVDPMDFYGGVESKQGSGSGIIVDSGKGIIITNLHVIQDAQKIKITLSDKKEYKAKLLGFDRTYDIAVLQIIEPPPNLTSLQFGDSSRLEVGQRVLAIGNPFGLDWTLTSGIISSLGRKVKGSSGTPMKDLIQTDAAINPGNSGGPLLDLSGRLIGINTAILSQSGDSAGIGFAVPINQIRRVLPELVATGRVLRPDLGMDLVDTSQGPMVGRLRVGGPADKAGLQPLDRFVERGFVRGYIRDIDRADLIVKINGKNIGSKEDIEETLQNYKSGDELTLTVRQGNLSGKERKIKLVPEFK